MKFTQNVKFFEELSSEVHEKCCKYITLEQMKAGEVVFELGKRANQEVTREGSMGTKFYIILRGRVGISVMIPYEVEVELENGQTEMRTEKRLTEIKIIGEGTYFGEKALLERKPRAATITCKDECMFAVLEKEFFELTISKRESSRKGRKKEEEQNMKINKNIKFLESVNLFSS